MPPILPALCVGLAFLFLLPLGAAGAAVAPRPAALEADGVPPVPLALVDRLRPWMEARSASFVDWHPEGGMLVATRFAATTQLHHVARPLGQRVQLSFEAEPIAWARFSSDGQRLALMSDRGGNEQFQLGTLAAGRVRTLTDGRSRHTGPVWVPGTRLVALASNARNGVDSDLVLVDAETGEQRMLAERAGGGWSFADVAPDGRLAVVRETRSVEDSRLHLVALGAGPVEFRPLAPSRRPVSFGEVRFGPDGRLFAVSDEGGEFRRLGTIDLVTGRFRPLGPPTRWDVEAFAVHPDGRRLAMVTNEAGVSVLRVVDAETGRELLRPELPPGVIGGLRFAPDGLLGLTLSHARSPGDAWSLDPDTGQLVRWVASETGGLDASTFVQPELVSIRSFDGQTVSGFLYRPDPARFPGPRPLLFSIHGGPEAQSRPGFLGAGNVYPNELGIALFFPNVRGSTGFGRRFVALDNGPWRREDSVRDIEAFARHLAADPGLDAQRFGVTGGSYGGYMTYASLTLYPRLWRSGLSVVGISDFVTFLENTADYRRDLRRAEYGDERDPRQRAQLAAISPLGRAHRIAVPLFVVTGANDPRVPASEAHQMVAAVRARGGEAWHLVAANEGHGFRRRENQDYQFWTSVMFWERTLLGDETRAAPPVP